MQQEEKEKRPDWEKYFEPLYAQDLLNMQISDQEWVVDKLIPNEGITIISGAPKSFKSWIALHIALCVENNEKVFGKYQATPSGVLIIDEENHLRITKQRMKMLGMTEESESDMILLNQNGFSASDLFHVIAISELCKDLEIKLVIMDSLVRIHNTDENSSRDMAELFENIKYLCKCGITVIVLHHERKEGMYKSSAQSRMRGSSDISAVVDSHISVKKDQQDKCKIIVEHAQSRCAPEEDPFEVRFSEIGGQAEFQYIGNTEARTRESKASKAISAIPQYLENHPEGMTHKELTQAIIDSHGVGSRTIRNAIRELIESGVISELPGGKGNIKLLQLKEKAEE